MSTDINIEKRLAILNEGANITTDATSIDFVGSGVNSSSVGGNVTITIPGGSGNTTYYLNQTVDQAPYKEFSSVATSAVEQVIPLTVLAGATSVIAEFQTPSGVPGTTQIPGGLWGFFLHFNAGSVGQNWIIRPTVYKRDLGGIETLLFTPDPEIVTGMSTTTTMYVSDGVFPATTLLTTDRIVVRISVQNTTGVSQTVNFRTEGSQHYSVGLTTLNQIIPTGAVTDVTGTAPIVSSGGTTPAISITQATGTTDGYLSSSDWLIFDSKLSSTRNITINGTTYDLSADRTWNVGTVTSVAALTLGTTGTDLSSSIATGTTTPVITLNVPTASAANRGALSSTDWSAFNSKIGGSGTINYLSKFTAASTLGNSQVQDNGTGVGIGVSPLAGYKLYVVSPTYVLSSNTTIPSITGENTGDFTGTYIGVYGYAAYADSPYVDAIYIGGKFIGTNGNNSANANSYSVQLQDGSEGINKFLKSLTADGKAQWANITVADTGLTVTTTGTSGASTLVGNTLNIPQYAGGLTYFTEAQSTTAPNATVNVDSLTAIASTTNADVVVRPKGTGALLSSIPDGTLAGGNKRGAYSVDLQLQRNNATHVASGTNCVISGGARNTATSTYSAVVGGYNNTSSNDYTVTGGYNNTASGYAATVFGNQNTGSGTANFVVGSLSTCTGNYDGALGSTNNVQSATRSSFAIGSNNTITAGGFSIALGGYNTLDGYVACAMGESNTGSGYSTMLGRNGWSNGTPKMVYSGYGWVIGDNQKSNLMLNARTTGATPTTLVVYQASNATPGALNQLILPNNSCFSVKGRIIGKKSGSTDVGVWDIDFIIVRGTTAAATSIVGTPSITVITNIPAWGTPTVTANTTLGCPTVQVTGIATTNIQWTFAPESVEVIYA